MNKPRYVSNKPLQRKGEIIDSPGACFPGRVAKRLINRAIYAGAADMKAQGDIALFPEPSEPQPPRKIGGKLGRGA